MNALSGRNQLTVWWFKEVTPPSAKFTPFFLPSKVGRYTVVYPVGKPQIVIASGIGTGDLGPSQQAGSVYYQNDVSQPGFNPNEEHALLLGKSAYALRDDLNNPSTTSQPFVLLAYTSPTDLRPSIDVFQVVRETFPYPLVTATASDQNANNTKSKGRTIVNMRAGVAELPLGSAKMEISLWVKNLIKENNPSNFIDFGPGFGGLTVGYFPDPRTYGLTVGAKF